MTNREYLSKILNAKTEEADSDFLNFLDESFGCPPSDFSTSEECHRHLKCTSCWHAWLEREVCP